MYLPYVLQLVVTLYFALVDEYQIKLVFWRLEFAKFLLCMVFVCTASEYINSSYWCVVQCDQALARDCEFNALMGFLLLCPWKILLMQFSLPGSRPVIEMHCPAILTTSK